jgi:hypothetical protein
VIDLAIPPARSEAIRPNLRCMAIDTKGASMKVEDSTRSPLRELAHRANDGVEVVLFWQEITNELTVSVSDARTGAYFELPAAPDQALDVFEHPYAHAAFRGLPYQDALLASWAQAENPTFTAAITRG